MKYLISISTFILGCLLMQPALSAEYQWSVSIKGNDPEARAFLWIPPNCHDVRGMIFASQVVLEKTFCDHEDIRAVCEREDMAIVILYRSPITYFKYKQGADTLLKKILHDLAIESGYNEIESVPLIPIGHSGGAIGAWNLAYWNPSRVLGIITLHAAAMTNPPEQDQTAKIGGIPVLAVSGEYESWDDPHGSIEKHWRWLRGDLLDIRAKYANAQVCEVVQPGAGHFNFDRHLAQLCALFISKLSKYRLTAHNEKYPVIRTIPEEQGWLTDITILKPPRYKPAPYDNYKGDPTLAFWHMDEEMAMAISTFPKLYGGKKDQRIGFMQNDSMLPPAWITDLEYKPMADGISFKVGGYFLNETPEGVANSGRPLKHGHHKIQYSLIGGWSGGGRQLNDSVFQISFDHFGFSRHTNSIMMMAYVEGDRKFKYAEQAGQIKFPAFIQNGEAQQIYFDSIVLQKGVNEVFLKASTNAGLRVSFFVRSGPAVIMGDQLLLTKIPPKAKYPVKLSIAAVQWGSIIHPGVKSAIPVIQDIYIQRDTP